MRRGQTKDYRAHPELECFRACSAPRSAINPYLAAVYAEARSRGYSFDRSKLGRVTATVRIAATHGQLEYEWQRLLGTLRLRDPETRRRNRAIRSPEPHPLFQVAPGPVKDWERPGPR